LSNPRTKNPTVGSRRIHHGKLSDFIVSDGNSIVFVRILGAGIQSEVIGVGKILD